MANAPRGDRRGPAPNIHGKTDISYPDSDRTKPRIVVRNTARQTKVAPNFATAYPDTATYPNALKTEDRSEIGDNHAVNSVEIFETLPGAALVDYYYQQERGAVTRTVQKVQNTGAETGSLTVTSSLATLVRYEVLNKVVLRKITETWALPGPTITVSHYEPESGIKITEARTMKQRSAITESNALSGASDSVRTLTTTEIRETGIGAALGMEVVTVYPAAGSYDSSTAIVEIKLKPYQFPGRINVVRNAPSQGHYDLDTYGTAIGYRRPTAELVPHRIKTWWVNASDAEKPVISFDNINPNTITINNVRYENVLHDDVTRYYAGLLVSIPATVPSYSDYMGNRSGSTWSGGWVNTYRIIDGDVSNLRRYRWKVQTIEVSMK